MDRRTATNIGHAVNILLAAATLASVTSARRRGAVALHAALAIGLEAYRWVNNRRAA